MAAEAMARELRWTPSMTGVGLRSAVAAALIVVASGCAGSEEPVAGDESALAAPRLVTVCFGGRTIGDPYSIGGIRELDDLCLKLPNLVRDDPGGRDARFAFFQWNTDLGHVLDRIVTTLDTNRDGVVTNLDEPASLSFVGYSWGGFNARDVAERVGTDPRFSPSRRGVARLFTMDAFRTDLLFPRAEIRIPGTVQTFYSFRHSVAPANECSSFLFGLIGPFLGRVPLCTGTSVCHDYDFSASQATAGVDHCDVPGAADDHVLAIVNGTSAPFLPPDKPVARY